MQCHSTGGGSLGPAPRRLEPNSQKSPPRCASHRASLLVVAHIRPSSTACQARIVVQSPNPEPASWDPDWPPCQRHQELPDRHLGGGPSLWVSQLVGCDDGHPADGSNCSRPRALPPATRTLRPARRHPAAAGGAPMPPRSLRTHLRGRPGPRRPITGPDRPPAHRPVVQPAVDQRSRPCGEHRACRQRSARTRPLPPKHLRQAQLHQSRGTRRYHRCLQQLEQGIFPTAQGLVHGLPEGSQGLLCCTLFHAHSFASPPPSVYSPQSRVALCPISRQDDSEW